MHEDVAAKSGKEQPEEVDARFIDGGPGRQSRCDFEIIDPTVFAISAQQILQRRVVALIHCPNYATRPQAMKTETAMYGRGVRQMFEASKPENPRTTFCGDVLKLPTHERVRPSRFAYGRAGHVSSGGA